MSTTTTRRNGACLLLVSGHPASGKSTLAALLSARLQLPVLAKDDVQEALFDAGIVYPHRTGVAANMTLMRIARRLLETGHDCIIDSNLEPGSWSTEVRALLIDTGACLLQVRCRAQGALQYERFMMRAGTRHPGHRDAERAQALRARLLGPPLAPLEVPGEVLDVDTGDDDTEALVRAVERALYRCRATLLR